ncbi:MAG: ankyrin repeat domain-containing protein [Acidiferrobacterales bacterium]|nr:ankyrin repeat domain-containing protein [Acidiferrobacterales bacterium]
MANSLETYFLELIQSSLQVVFIDESWVFKQSEKYRKLLRESAKTKFYFELESNCLSEEGVVSAIAQFKVIIEDQSGYRRACDFLERKKSGFMVFHQSHAMSSDVLHLVSRLIRFCKRQNLDWKFVFFASDSDMNSLMADQLFIEKFYPSKSRNKLIGKTSKPKKKSYAFVVPLVIAICSASVFYFIQKNYQAKPNSLEDTVPAIPANDIHTESINIANESSANDDLLEMIRQSKLRDLEFKGMLEELESQDDSQTDTAADNLLEQATISKAEDISAATNTNASSSSLANQRKPALQMSADAERAIKDNDLASLQRRLDTDRLRLSQNDSGETPLIIATNHARLEIIDWLLQKNVPVNSTDRYGRTAIFYAAINGNNSIVESLLDAGADAGISSNLLKTPLMAAVNNDHVSTTQMLLRQNVSIDDVDHSGWSAIFYAVWNANLELTTLLVENGARLDLTDNNGVSLKDIAQAKREANILDLL